MAIKNPKTPRVTRRAKKTAALYKANPTWAKEDAPGAYKKGGTTKMKKYAMGEPKLSKYQKKGAVTPFQNYMKVPGAMASDTTQSFTGSRDGSNPVLDKAYYDTYYAGQENKKRTGNDKVKYDTNGKRIYKTGGMVNANAKINAIKKPTGIVGGTSKAPKKAVPKAQLGAIMKAGKMLDKIAQAPGGKTVIGGGLAAGILGLNKLGSNKSSLKPKGTKAAKSVMSKAFPTISKSKMGGMKGKSC